VGCISEYEFFNTLLNTRFIDLNGIMKFHDASSIAEYLYLHFKIDVLRSTVRKHIIALGLHFVLNTNDTIVYTKRYLTNGPKQLRRIVCVKCDTPNTLTIRVRKIVVPIFFNIKGKIGKKCTKCGNLLYWNVDINVLNHIKTLTENGN